LLAAAKPLCDGEKLSLHESLLIECRSEARQNLRPNASEADVCEYLNESVNVCGELIKPCLVVSDLR
jgi:hypothetical protein